MRRDRTAEWYSETRPRPQYLHHRHTAIRFDESQFTGESYGRSPIWMSSFALSNSPQGFLYAAAHASNSFAGTCFKVTLYPLMLVLQLHAQLK